jgi:hypothetical protein
MLRSPLAYDFALLLFRPQRDVSHLLFWLQHSLFEAAPQLRIKITKPLFAWETPSGLCRPDFVLETTYGNYEPVNLIVEAFGMDTDEYKAAKEKTLPRMREIAPVFEIRPLDISQANADETGKRLQHWVLDHSRHSPSRSSQTPILNRAEFSGGSNL